MDLRVLGGVNGGLEDTDLWFHLRQLLLIFLFLLGDLDFELGTLLGELVDLLLILLDSFVLDLHELSEGKLVFLEFFESVLVTLLELLFLLFKSSDRSLEVFGEEL